MPKTVYYDEPVTVYVSLDNGGGVLSSKRLDNVTWVEEDEDADLLQICSNGVSYHYVLSRKAALGVRK